MEEEAKAAAKVVAMEEEVTVEVTVLAAQHMDLESTESSKGAARKLESSALLLLDG